MIAKIRGGLSCQCLKFHWMVPVESQRNVLKSMLENISYKEQMSEESGRFVGCARVNDIKNWRWPY